MCLVLRLHGVCMHCKPNIDQAFPTPHPLTNWGILFMQNWQQGLAHLEFFKSCSFWHHTLSSFFSVDLAVELASNWHGVEAMRNLGPVEDLRTNVEWLNVRKTSKNLSLQRHLSTNVELEFVNSGYKPNLFMNLQLEFVNYFGIYELQLSVRNFFTHCKEVKFPLQ